MIKYVIGKALRELGVKHPAPMSMEPPDMKVEPKKLLEWEGVVHYYAGNPPVKNKCDLYIKFKLDKKNDIVIIEKRISNEK